MSEPRMVMLMREAQGDIRWDPADDTPVEIPAGMEVDLSLEEKLRLMVMQAVSDQAGDSGMETFEEFDNFDLVDDEVSAVISPHQLDEAVELIPDLVNPRAEPDLDAEGVAGTAPEGGAPPGASPEGTEPPNGGEARTDTT